MDPKPSGHRNAPLHMLAGMLVAVAALLGPGMRAVRAAPVTALLQLPDGAHGLGLDDMDFLPALDRVVVPGAQSGNLVLIDPANDHMRVLRGITARGGAVHGHDAGTTSAAYGQGLLLASDHDRQDLLAVNPHTGAVLDRVHLAAQPDYVRYVAPLREVWVTEPHGGQIERFALNAGGHPVLRRVGRIAIADGPEGLVVDAGNGTAYANTHHDHTLVIPLADPRVAARWNNTCAASHGLALDAAQHTLFVGCKEGKVVALDTAAHGRVIASERVGVGVDLIAWNPVLRHLYAPGARSATMAVLAYDGRTLHSVVTVPTASGAHCVASDGRSVAYVCDPRAGALIVFRDHR